MREPFTDANYTSIVDFLDAVSLPCLNSKNAHIHTQYMDSHRGSWYGADCHTGHDVKKTMNDGWPDGRQRMNDLRAQIGVIDLAPVDRRRRLTRGPSGDTLDMNLVYSGRFDIAWRAPRRRTTAGPQKVEICANMICSGMEHADVLFWRGAAAAVLADMLESAGYMVRLVVNFGGQAESLKTSCRITVKEHGVPFDITSTSAVILPGFFRALGHAWIANHAPHKRTHDGIMVGQGNVEPGEILLSHNVRDHGTALDAVRSAIEHINAGKAEAA